MNENHTINVPILIPEVVDAFHKLYYHFLGWDKYTYLGHQIKQCPFDLQIYQEMIFNLRPKYIIQTGVAGGGSVLYFATMLDLIGADKDAVVIGIDVTLTPAAKTLKHPRIRLIEGSSSDPQTIQKIESMVPNGIGLVSLDSDHSAKHVLDELRIYNKFVGNGSYLVVEDSNINGHPVFPNFGAGPYEGTELYLQEEKRFVLDNEIIMRNLFSFHLWLKRIS